MACAEVMEPFISGWGLGGGPGWWGLWSGLKAEPQPRAAGYLAKRRRWSPSEVMQGGPGYGNGALPLHLCPGPVGFPEAGVIAKRRGQTKISTGVGVTGKEEERGQEAARESRVDCTSGKALGGSRRNGGMAQLGSQEDVSQTLVRTDVRP